MNEGNPTVSNHYKDDAGQRYVLHHQADPYRFGYELNFNYFKPYLKSTDTVLDFGCGNGGMLRLIQQVVQRAEGLEVNPFAREIVQSMGLTILSSLDELPLGPVYDVVVSNHALEHIRDVSSTLERVRLSMKPNAMLLLKLPIDDWRADYQRKWARDDVDHHLQTWTPRLIGNVLYETGYDVENVRIITSAWHPKLFPLFKLGMGPLAFWALAVFTKHRQIFVVGRARH